MLLLARLAGFFAAHGMWSIADGGGPITPLLGHEKADGRRGGARFADEDLELAVKAGQAALAGNAELAARAVLVFDGYVPLPSGRTDALIIEGAEYEPALRTLRMAVPYRPSPFAVFRPKFLLADGVERDGFAALGDAFYAGVDSHEQAGPLWNASLDQSI
ncbi:hypothetical protein [Actinoplanes sp. L3-i22]|uniref:hypothetical protein n=1 Tax=Actinoplanes sp. L3-i22 TaxID=2836373 RepID=UPI001C77CB1A|nr:hypothetical protein [Actinoplanes sp. L3-i22]BCY11986.1 hypothetical protein L3i22_070740 [Actinoplanes sp. L3-i22]